MKKLIALLMALTMVAMMAACSTGNNETPATDATEATEAVNVPTVGSALEVLETIWNAYGEDEKFAIIGGNIEDAVDGAPGNYNMEYKENLPYNLLVPEAELANIDEAGFMQHGMNANNFTAGVVHVTGDVTAFAAAMQSAIQNNQWMCGFPETLVIAAINDSYVLVSFGVNDAMNLFIPALSAAYADANILYNEAIGG